MRLREALGPGLALSRDGPERLRLRGAEDGGSIPWTEWRVRTAQAWGAGPREGLCPRPACAYCACAGRGRRLGLLENAVRPSAPACGRRTQRSRAAEVGFSWAARAAGRNGGRLLAERVRLWAGQGLCPPEDPRTFPLLCWALRRLTAGSATAGPRPSRDTPTVPRSPHPRRRRGASPPATPSRSGARPPRRRGPSSCLSPLPLSSALVAPLRVSPASPLTPPILSLPTPPVAFDHKCLEILGHPPAPSLVSPPGRAPSVGPSLTFPRLFQQTSPGPSASVFQ